jgi:transcriptional regulator with PAS, ATPase and Fis domain
MNYDAVGACLNRMILPVKPPENTGKYPGEDLLAGNSPAVVSLRRRLIKYSDLCFPVLITGETGSGKDLAAKTIHLHSPRNNQPFVTINCASYPEDLLTTEMFGSHKGAFTGSTDRPGLFESADKGTLFLDEIGELSIRSQGSLLRVIEDGYIRRIGSFKTKKVNVRIIAATNRNLRQCIREGTFRSDLFYRLNLLGVSVPPLRRRKEDIPVLARNYLAEIQQEIPLTVENAALTLLARYNWPGNVRELQSVLLRASLFAERGKIRKSDICLPYPENEVSFSEEL